MNNRGQVIGSSGIKSSNNSHAFLCENGVMTDLGTLPGGSLSGAKSINNNGQVVGTSDTENGQQHAFLWEKGVMTDLGDLGGTYSESFANSLNASSQVIGTSRPRFNNGHAFLWEGGVMTDLGTLGGLYSNTVAINNRGQVVGNADIEIDPNGIGDFFHTHGFIWEDGIMTDLGTLGGLISGASVINNRGQVAGNSITATGEWHAVLWDKKHEN
jgi:probable HAF family extracellular repeat protein